MEAVIIIFIVGSVNAVCQEICNGISWGFKQKADEIIGWAFVSFIIVAHVAVIGAFIYNIFTN